MYWNEKIECASREEMRQIQGENLSKAIQRIYKNVPAYRKKMDDAGVKPDDIKTIDDIAKLPFTYKQDLRDNYPYGLFAVPLDDVVRIHASSGTTGKQTVVGYTENDIKLWQEVLAREFYSMGISKKDVIHIAYGYGLFTGGLGMHYGGEGIGASVIPVSTGNTPRQIQIMKDFGSTVLCATPSYGVYLAETLADMNIKPGDLKLKVGIFGAEPWTEEMRSELEQGLGIKAYDVYGLSEIIGPGVSCECTAQAGMHIQEDHFIPEIIDPDTEEVLTSGIGELVITCPTKEALPLIRYRTRDIVSLNYEKCACGRTLVRMNKVSGRSDDMLIIRGVNVFPSQIESVLLDLKLTEPHYKIIVDRINNLDTLEIMVEMSEEMFSDEVKKIEKVQKTISHAIESTLSISAKITLVEPRSIGRSEGKAKRVEDRRGAVK